MLYLRKVWSKKMKEANIKIKIKNNNKEEDEEKLLSNYVAIKEFEDLEVTN